MTARPSSSTFQVAKGAVAGLDAEAPYSSRLSARSALYTELHQLLDAEDRALTSAEYRHRIVAENRLAKASTAARAKLWKELKARYRLDAADPLFAAFWAEWQRCTSEAERALTPLPSPQCETRQSKHRKAREQGFAEGWVPEPMEQSSRPEVGEGPALERRDGATRGDARPR